MSNIGKKPVKILEGVQVKIEDGKMVVSGPKGTLVKKVPPEVSIEISDGEAKVKKGRESRDLEKYFGLARALLANMVEGVTKGFEKKLELSGVGYRAKVEGEELVLNLGFANPVRFKSPEGINISVAENMITVGGIDKELVGNIASNIREIRTPDPYKAKGIKYEGEKIRRKVGKAAKAVGAK